MNGDAETTLLDDILGAEDRDHELAPRPVVSVRPDDEESYLEQVDERCGRRVELTRRGQHHGEWAELIGKPRGLEHRPSATEKARWRAAQPLVRRVLSLQDLDSASEWIEEALARHTQLTQAGAIRRWLEDERTSISPEFTVHPREASLLDPERDIERVELAWRSFGARAEDKSARSGRRMNDLWIKSGWLSTSEDDASIRVRFSFGREGRDDASRNAIAHHLVADLANRVMPECELIDDNRALIDRLEELCGEPVFFTQHIAYWNTPEGGALFHHDAFDEDPLGGQLGVCFVQLFGSTAWLALSLDELVSRVIEFIGYLHEGELAWVRSQLFGDERSWLHLIDLQADPEDLRRELALPGCGFLGPLVNRGPEFTSFLADAGHAVVLDPGEAILLPNYGLSATAMHSVFCASPGTTYALSLGIRGARAAQ